MATTQQQYDKVKAAQTAIDTLGEELNVLVDNA